MSGPTARVVGSGWVSPITGQSILGEVQHIQLPPVGKVVEVGTVVVTLESTKSLAEVCAPVHGTVVAVNGELTESPGLVNEDPHRSGWMVDIEGDPAGLDALLDAQAYSKTLD